MRHILKCPKCHSYTLKSDCCEKTLEVKPPKFTLVDKYAGYRREAKRLIENAEERQTDNL